MGISSNAAEILKRMRARPAAVKRELEGVAKTYAPKLQGESRKILSAEVYSQPVPKRKRSGKPEWKRGGGLLRAEKGKSQGVDIILSNGQKYSVARNNLGTSRGKKIKSSGVKSVQWQEQAVEKLLPEIKEARRQGVLRGLASP